MWFYDHYNYFSPLLQSDEEESEEGSDSEEEEGDEEGNLAFYSLKQNVKLEDEISVPKAKRSGSCTSFPDEEVLCKDEMSVPQEKYSDSRIPFYDEELPLVDETSVPEGRHSNFNFSFPEKVDSSTFTEVTELLSQIKLQRTHVVSSLISHTSTNSKICYAKRMRNISLVISILFPFTFSLLSSISFCCSG